MQSSHDLARKLLAEPDRPIVAPLLAAEWDRQTGSADLNPMGSATLIHAAMSDGTRPLDVVIVVGSTVDTQITD